ncbi:sperm-associated antigen 6-like [Aphidius gifuensis]|uniref:sperm-associated antigen 6-like n=1 Tax=Aphidius gifuensis TaxID=684658 RepID=UPI001CDC15D6|nr:sperm-associated antigen 6-like [Aphidius gifuensis]
MTSRTIVHAMHEYQIARLNFVKSMSDLASRSQNIENLEAAGVLNLLGPLVIDINPTVQHTAVTALGKIANHDERLARAVVNMKFISQLLKNIEKQNKFFKKSALFVLRSVVKHSPELAKLVVIDDPIGMEAMIVCLEDFDPGVKESAAWAIGYVGKHNSDLAQSVVSAGALPLLVLCLQEPEISLKQISTLALSDISKHSLQLAQSVTDTGGIAYLVKLIQNPDYKLKRQVFYALSNIAKHSVNLAESVLEADIFPDVLEHMGHPDENVQKAAATLTREICKHTLELAQLVVNTGGIGALIEVIITTQSARLPAIMSLGYIAGHSDQLAMVIIGSKGVAQLSTLLNDDNDDHVLSITVWTLGQIGKHSHEHAKAIAIENIFPKILYMYSRTQSSEDLKSKSKSTLKNVLQKCIYFEALEQLLHTAPPEILKYVLKQYSQILPNDPKSRRLFVTSGGLKKVQEIYAEPGTSLSEYIGIINCCFPAEIVRYYSPGYPEDLLEIVENFQPSRNLPVTTGNKKKSKVVTSSSTSNSSLSLKNEKI